MALSPFPIRIFCNTSNKKDTSLMDVNTNQLPAWYRGDDIEIDIGIGATIGGVDTINTSIANVASITCQLFLAENDTNAALMEKTVSGGSINGALTQEQWVAGKGLFTGQLQHAAFLFSKIETMISLGGSTTKQFWLRIFATTNSGQNITLNCGTVTVKDGPVVGTASVPLSDNLIPLTTGAALVPAGAVYDGTGNYTLNGLTNAKIYYWLKAGNDFSAAGLTVTGTFTQAGTTLTMHGIPGALVTAQVYLATVYDGAGNYTLTGLGAGGLYYWLKNANDATAAGVNASGYITVNASSITLTGTANALVTAKVRAGNFIKPYAGSYAIPNGYDRVTVTGLGLLFTPTLVIAVITQPAGALQLFPTIVQGTLTTDGFTATLNGMTDSGNYAINYMIF